MAQPTRYSRSYSFTGYQAGNPSDPLPAQRVDAEFDAVALTTDETRQNLALIQRDDGKLRNESVHPDAFDGASLLLMGSRNWTPRGEWATGTIYAVGDMVENGNGTFVAVERHLSASFDLDRADGKWTAIREAVDSVSAVKSPARLATTENITLAGLQSVDGVTTVAGDRVLVKDQTDGTANGIYIASSSGWARAADFDENEEVVSGVTVRVNEGTDNGGQTFTLTTTDPIAVGTTALTWALSTEDMAVVATGSTERRRLTDRFRDRLDVRDFGALGSDANTNTETIQAAIDAAADEKETAHVPAGTYPIEATQTQTLTVNPACLIARSGTRLVFEPGARLEMVESSAGGYAMLACNDVEDVEIRGGTFVGDLSVHTGTSGQSGHGLSTRGVKGLRVHGTIFREFWGDGIYIGQGSGAEPSEDVYLEAIKSLYSRRQGLSIISVKSLTAIASHFSYTGQLAGSYPAQTPTAGIDIEPNNTSCELQDILFIACVTDHNGGAGFVLPPVLMGGAGKEIGVSLIRHSSRYNANGYKFSPFAGGLRGVVLLDHCLSHMSQLAGIDVTGWPGTDSPRIIINHPTIENANEQGVTSQFGGSGIVIRRESGDTEYTPTIGNVELLSPVVKDRRDTGKMVRGIYVRDAKTPDAVEGVIISDPIEVDGGTNNQKITFSGSGRVTDGNRILSRAHTSSVNLSSASWAPRMTNEGASGLVTITLHDVWVPGGPDIIFEVVAAQTLRIAAPAGNVINPIAGDGKWIQSNVPGSRVTMRKTAAGVWNVIEMIGPWTVQDAGVPAEVTATANLTLPARPTYPPHGPELIIVNGDDGITSINASNNSGRFVALKFTGTPTVTDGSNLKLDGNFTAAADGMLTIFCDGTNWNELARSAN